MCQDSCIEQVCTDAVKEPYPKFLTDLEELLCNNDFVCICINAEEKAKHSCKDQCSVYLDRLVLRAGS